MSSEHWYEIKQTEDTYKSKIKRLEEEHANTIQALKKKVKVG